LSLPNALERSGLTLGLLEGQEWAKGDFNFLVPRRDFESELILTELRQGFQSFSES
jgi:hypothetical protein